MADLTITITVSASIDGQAFRWSRSATITSLDSAIFGARQTPHNSGQAIGGSEAGSLASLSDGLYSYTGIAVGCFVHASQNAVIPLTLLDSTGTLITGVMMSANVPFIVYGGYDFNGAAKSSGTSTDTPTVDVDGVIVSAPFIGTGSIRALVGLKAIS